MSRIRYAAATLAAAILILPLSAGAAPAPSVTPPGAYDPSHVIVTFDASASAAARAATHRTLGTTVTSRIDRWNIEVVALPDGLSAVDAVRAYSGRDGVERVSFNKVLRKLDAPNDALFGQQWGFHNTGQLVSGSLVTGVLDADIDAPEGWTTAFGAGRFESTGGTRVAVLDTGVDLGHADLVGKVVACAGSTSGQGIVVPQACQDDGAHGTHTAGTVGANTGNAAGVAGTAPNAQLVIFKFLNAAGLGFLADEIAGLNWAISQGAKVFSMSYGSTDPDGTEEAALRDASNAGVLPIAAAGNDYDSTLNYPAAYPGVMSVASHNAADRISDFSNCNSDVEIAAPGEDVWSTLPGNSYGVLSGTSMATPHVAGVAALVMSEKALTNTQTRNQLVNTGVAVASNGGRNACNGLRRVNLAAALGSTNTTPQDPGAIAGTVTSQATGTPLSGATVSCGTAGTATTATNGTYSLTNVPVGSYSCTASKSGYRNKNATASVASGQTTTLDFALRTK